MPSIKASSQGLVRIKQAIARKGWKISSDRPLIEASKVLEPDKHWDEFTPFAYGCSRQTWERFLRGIAIRDRSFRAFCQMLEVDPDAVSQVNSYLKEDWGEAPEVPSFYGRQQELEILEQWIINEGCSLVSIVGFAGIGKTRLVKGGIGKTDLSLQLTRKIHGEFEYLIWRRLLNAPPVDNLLTELIEFVSSDRELELASTTNDLITQLLDCLKKRRCLLVLDNVESILQSQDRAANYQSGYEGYGDLFIRIGESKHKSCLLLTTRIKPKEIEEMENVQSVRSLELEGLDLNSGRAIFTDIGRAYNTSFIGTETDWQTLISFYNGNPLALEVTARQIVKQFDGNLTEFLQQDLRVFGKIRDLLDWHFARLTADEKTVMYWLALNREVVSIADLQADIFSPLTKKYLPEIINNLERKIPIEKTAQHRFTLQPVLMEYISDRAIAQICQELRSGKLQLFNSHALVKASAKDYVKASQIRIILQPIIEQLSSELGYETDRSLESQLSQILSNLNRQRPGYAGGNIINLMGNAKLNLAGYDFSNMTIWQADLQDLELHSVDFASCQFANSSFTQDFGGIHAIAMSPDGKILAGGDSQGIIYLYRVRDRQQLFSLKGHVANTWISSLAFSSDSKLLVSSSISLDHAVKIWDVTTGECLQTFKEHQQWVWSVAFSPKVKTVASGSDDDTIRIWNLATGKCRVLRGSKRVWTVAFNSERILASGGFDRTIRLWDVVTGECIKTFLGHQAPVWAVAFSADGQTLASGSADKTIKLWDVETGKCRQTLEGHTREVRSLAFSTGNRLVSGSFDRTVRLWDTTTGNLLKTLKGHVDQIWAVTANPQTDTIASGDKSQIIKLWNAESGKCLTTIRGYANWIWTIAISCNGLLASGGLDKDIRLWNPETGTVTATLKGHQNMIWSVKFSADGQLLASCSDDATIKLWNIATGECLNTFQDTTPRGVWTLEFSNANSQHSKPFSSDRVSPDGKFLIGGRTNGLIQIWDVLTGNLIHSIEAHDGWIWNVTFSPNEQYFASCSKDRTVKFWDINTGSCLACIKDIGNVMFTAFSPDSQMLVCANEDSQIKLLKTETGRCLQNFSGHTDSVWALAFIDEQTFVSASADKTIRLWDIKTGKCVKVLTGHTAWVRAIAFTPGDRQLVSSSTDGTIRFWDLATGETVKVLRYARPYEGMNIQNVQGLTTAQQRALIALGAKE